MARAPVGLVVLALAAAPALGWNLGGYRLLDPDEGRTAEIAREMVATRNYMVPQFDGLPYLDKPVGYFAAAAVAMATFGPTEAAARLPALLATLATAVVLFWFARRLWGETAGWLAGLSFATMPLTLGYAHVALVDSALTLTTTAALVSFADERPTLAWGSMAVGALIKGPVAFAVPAVTVVPYAIVTGTPVRRFVTWRGLGLCAALVLPWFAAVTTRFPDFPAYVFLRETLERFATPAFHRSGPVWYYLPILAAGAFPWIVPACTGVGRARSAWQARHDPAMRESILLAAWVLGPLVLFSIDHSKLPHYLLPLLPPLALAAARAMTARGPETGAGFSIPAAALAVGVVAWSATLTARLPLTPSERAAVGPVAGALGAALVGFGACLALAVRLRRLDLGALAYALPAFVLAASSPRLMTAVGEDRSAARLASAIAPVLGPHDRVLGVATFPPSLPFYLRRPVSVATADAHELTSNYVVAHADVFRGPTSPLLGRDEWQEALARCPVATVFVVPAGDARVRAQFAALPLIADDGHNVAFGPCRPVGRE